MGKQLYTTLKYQTIFFFQKKNFEICLDIEVLVWWSPPLSCQHTVAFRLVLVELQRERVKEEGGSGGEKMVELQ